MWGLPHSIQTTYHNNCLKPCKRSNSQFFLSARSPNPNPSPNYSTRPESTPSASAMRRSTCHSPCNATQHTPPPAQALCAHPHLACHPSRHHWCPASHLEASCRRSQLCCHSQLCRPPTYHHHHHHHPLSCPRRGLVKKGRSNDGEDLAGWYQRGRAVFGVHIYYDGQTDTYSKGWARGMGLGFKP